MAYTVTCDGVLLHDSRLAGVQLLEPEVTLELNSAQAFTFALPIDSPRIADINRLTSTIVVKRVGVEEPLFVGRVVASSDKIDDLRTYQCEGDLAYLFDSVKRPYEFNDEPRELLAMFLAEHNEQVPPNRQLSIGSVTVTDPNNYIVRSKESYEQTYDELMSKSAGSSLGGYLRTSGPVGSRVVDWLAESGKPSGQELRFGTNLLDFTSSLDAGPLCTAILPLGGKLGEESNERLTVASVNGGLDIVDDVEAVELYGRIVGTQTWDDVNTASILLDRAHAWLATGRLMTLTLELTAVDLSLLDASVEQFNLGDDVHVIAEPFGLDVGLPVTAISISLTDPTATNITIGGKTLTMTDSVQDNTDRDNILDEIEWDLGDRIDAIQKTANGKNSVTYSDYPPTTETPGVPGDIYFQRDGNVIIGQYICTAGNGEPQGNLWEAQEIDGIIIANIDAGTITTGFLGADRISANSITSDKITAGAITAEKLSATAITGKTITGGTITGTTVSGTTINGGTVTGTRVQTAASGSRVELYDNHLHSMYSNGQTAVYIGALTTGDQGILARTQAGSDVLVANTYQSGSFQRNDIGITSNNGGNIRIRNNHSSGQLLAGLDLTYESSSQSAKVDLVGPYLNSYSGNRSYRCQYVAANASGASGTFSFSTTAPPSGFLSFAPIVEHGKPLMYAIQAPGGSGCTLTYDNASAGTLLAVHWNVWRIDAR